MGKTRLIQKITLGLICLSVLVLIGLSIYQHMLLKNLSPVENSESIENEEPAEIVLPEAGGAVQNITEKSTPSAIQEQRQAAGDIEALEEQLEATEAELDSAHQKLTDEAARKEELRQKELELQRQYTSDPSFRSYMRASLDTQLADLFEELNLSPEELENFKDIYIDRTMALSEIYPEISSATTKEQKADLQKRMAEIREEYETKIKESLGSKYDIYYDYTEMALTRSVINGFKASLSPEDQLTEEQGKELTKIMYKEQMAVFAEIGYDPRKEIEFESDVKSGDVDGELKNMEKIHTRSIANSKGVLSASQLEQYEKYLKSQREMQELYDKLSD